MGLTRGLQAATKCVFIPFPPNPGLQLASVVVLPRSLAQAFESFCQGNHGPLPILGQSEPEKTLPQLSTAPDIR